MAPSKDNHPIPSHRPTTYRFKCSILRFSSSSPSVRHQFVISSSSARHQLVISSSSARHQLVISSSPARHPRDAKSEEHEERAPAIFPPAVLIFGLPRQKNMLKYDKKMLKYAKICCADSLKK